MSNPEPIKRKTESTWGLKWTPELDEAILRFWDQGMSARAIAIQLGDRSRNACIGRLNRLKAPKRNPPKERIKRSPADNARSQKSPAHLAADAAVEMSRTEYDQSPKLFDGVPRTIGTVEAGECKWMAGTPSPTETVCGHPQKFNSPYCQEHHERGHDKNGPASAERRAQGAGCGRYGS